MAFLITLFSGLSTLIGFFIIFINNNKKDIIIPFSLMFASIIMISVSLFDLLKESFNILNNYFYFNIAVIVISIFFIIGLIISNYFDKLFNSNNKLYRLGMLSLITIIFHNIPEGIITYFSYIKNINLGISMALAITLHNISEGITIAIPIYYSTKSKSKTFIYVLIAALSEFLGAIIAFLLKDFIKDYMIGIILSITAGIMIQIALFELIPNALVYKNNKLIIISLIIGLIFSYLFII